MRLFALALVLVLLASACGDDQGSTPDDTADRGATPTVTGVESTETTDVTATTADAQADGSDVRTSTVTLIDDTRTTPATDGAGEQPIRTLEVHLYEPTGPGPFPLIVFAHGLNGHPRKFTTLHKAWAAAGYVVAAPTFPVSNDLAPGGGDFIGLNEQPADMSFVLDQLLGAESPLTASVDPTRIGAGGLSLGGATVYGLVYDDCCRDDRVVAAMVLDGNQLGFTIDLTAGPPLLLVHADPDPALPYANAVANFAAATVPASFLTLHETAHAEPYENDADPADDLVEAVTIGWWDLHLGDDATAHDRISDAVAAAGPLATWEPRPD